MKVLLTGGTGLIGRRVGQLLVAGGHEVTLLSRNPEAFAKNPAFPARLVRWSGDSDPFPVTALEGVDGVIHLAGENLTAGRWNDETKRRIRDSRVQGTRRLNEALQAVAPEARPRALIGGSAVGFYGDGGDRTLTESSPAGTGYLAQVCQEWESGILQGEGASAVPGIRRVAIRTGVVLAEGGGALPRMLLPFQLGLGGAISSGNQWMSWIHLEDIAGLFVFALENETVRGVLNGVSPEPETNREFSRKLAAVFGHRLGPSVPAVVLKGMFGEMASVLLSGQRCLPEETVKSGFQFRFPRLEAALSDLLHGRENGSDVLLYEQWVPRPKAQVFEYFSSARNLEELTPPFLRFETVSVSTQEMREGTLIDYRLKLNGIPMAWRTLISVWQPGARFVDEQLKGPYRQWHHTHEFEELGGGTLLRDRVLFKLPMGLVGKAVAWPKVKSDLRRIFGYRQNRIHALFGGIG